MTAPSAEPARDGATDGGLDGRAAARADDSPSNDPLLEESGDDALLRIGIVTVSDRAARGEYPDASGEAIRACLTRWIASPWVESYRCIPDERPLVEATLVELTEWRGCRLIITTGGTGPALRDVTPDATEAVCDRLLPGFGEAMRAASLRTVPTAILSRQVAGTRGQTLIVNLPGKPRSIPVCLAAVWPGLAPCLKLLGVEPFVNGVDAPVTGQLPESGVA
jgi:molybdopterin adenylyltransferase